MTTNKTNFFRVPQHIGKKNIIILRKLPWKNATLLKSYEVGGTDSRTMLLEISSGKVTIKE